MKIYFTLEQLEEKAKKRPQGYKQDVLAASKKIDEHTYELGDVEFSQLAEKYRLPSFLEMAKNVAQSVAIAIANPEFRHPEKIIECAKICQSCPLFIEESNRCGSCGCYLGIKIKFAEFECPENKWKD